METGDETIALKVPFKVLTTFLSVVANEIELAL